MQKKIGDTLYFRNEQGSASFYIDDNTTGNSTKTRYLKRTHQFSDAARQYFQNMFLKKNITYDKAKEKAVEELTPVFKKLGIDEESKNDKYTSLEKKEMRTIAYSNWIEKHIYTNADLEQEVSFEEMIDMVNPPSSKRTVNKMIEIIENLEERLKYDISCPRINLKTGDITHYVYKTPAIPKVILELTNDVPEEFRSSREAFKKWKAKNKQKYIQSIKLRYDREFLFFVAGIGNNYSTSSKRIRDNFKGNCHVADTWMQSIKHLYKNKNAMTFTVDEVRKRLVGKDSTIDTRYLIRDYIKPCIEDLKVSLNRNVEFIEIKDGKKIVGFYIKMGGLFEKKSSFLNEYVYFQVNRMEKVSIRNRANFNNFFSEKSDDNEYFYGKTLKQWKLEAAKEEAAENSLLELMKLDIFTDKELEYKDQVLLKREFDNEQQKRVYKYIFVSKEGVKKPIIKPSEALDYLIDIVRNGNIAEQDSQNSIEAEIISENDKNTPKTDEDCIQLARYFYEKHTSLNKGFEVRNDINTEGGVIQSITEDTSYEIEDIIMVVDWLFSEKGNWFRPNIDSCSKLKDKFQYMYGHAAKLNNQSPSAVVSDINILDMLKEVEE